VLVPTALPAPYCFAENGCLTIAGWRRRPSRPSTWTRVIRETSLRRRRHAKPMRGRSSMRRRPPATRGVSF